MSEVEQVPSFSMQGIAREMEDMQKDENLGEKQSVAEAVKVPIGWGSVHQANGFTSVEKESHEAILLSCVQNGESLIPDDELTSKSSASTNDSIPDDESTSTSSASTNDSITCVYSYPMRRRSVEESSEKETDWGARFKAYRAELADQFNELKAMMEMYRKQNHAKSGGEQADCSRGRGRGRATGRARCLVSYIPEPIAPTQKSGDVDGDSDDEFY